MVDLEEEAYRCKVCGDKVCICCDHKTNKWAAHCMTCNNAIGHIGWHDCCADSAQEAFDQWQELNKGHNQFLIDVRLSLEDDCYIATAEKYSGLATHGDTIEEAINNVKIVAKKFDAIFKEDGE